MTLQQHLSRIVRLLSVVALCGFATAWTHGGEKAAERDNESSRGLSTGVARITVTPPVGIAMSGFAGRDAATGIHDDLYATALVLVSDDTKAAVVAADLIGFGDDFTSDVRAEVERRTGIPAAAVFLCASHTHYGPSTRVYGSDDPAADLDAYMANLLHLLAGAVQEAVSVVQPVRVGVGRGACDVGINRREKRPDGVIILGNNPDGPMDREVIVVRLDTVDGEPLATLVNYACHPVCQRHKARNVSGDFIAPMRDLVEKATGAKCLYLQGACGNVNPALMDHSFEPARKSGIRLGEEAVKAFEGITTSDAVGVATTSAQIDFPASTFGSEDEGRQTVKAIEEKLAQLKKWKTPEGRIKREQRRLEQANKALESIVKGEPLPAVVGEIATLRFGDVALVMTPGEVFAQIGKQIKESSPLTDTLFVGYTDGSIGYVPTPDAYPEGGYEVERACRVSPDASRTMIQEALRQLNELAKSG